MPYLARSHGCLAGPGSRGEPGGGMSASEKSGPDHHPEPPSARYPEPYLLFQSVRGETGSLLDFQWTAHNPAAAFLVAGLSRLLSGWQGVVGMPERGVLGALVDEIGRAHV